MKKNIYYGEYSLSHWVDLIISKDIVLPEYQRLFVWRKEKVEEFLDSVNKNEFIPPVTIGLFKIDGRNVNYILDGQQRLTSILLACLGKFPKKTKDVLDYIKTMNENDDPQTDDDEVDLDAIQDWTLKKLTDLGSTYTEITDRLNEKQFEGLYYDNFGAQYGSNFYHNHYLGFSYIVPDTGNEAEQQRFYSSVFRNINIKGERLLEMESRESLYFLDKDKKDFFKPDIKDYAVVINKERYPLDFVRYMSLLSQYNKVSDNNSDPGKVSKVARGFKPKMEEYYEQYIYSQVGDDQSEAFDSFTTTFPNGNYKPILEKLMTTLDKLNIPKEFPSIIDIDVYFFGLIYQVVFLKKEIRIGLRNNLIGELNSQITAFKKDERHKKSPASLKYLRSRMTSSIGIYNKYVKNEQTSKIHFNSNHDRIRKGY